MNTEQYQQLEHIAQRRSIVAAVLTAAMMTVYFGFILLVAFWRDFMSTLLTTGLSIGIVLGALVIILAWLFTYVYVRWANTRYDTALARLQDSSTK
ncbi:MAG: DUF485 domain-containing protein [Bacteroidota bacterium]|nr:DUF485 domain-containing protein [Candidatus Kapabacteria bacterium]MDW8220775.1 DUF485 domain-containing protein [Bacteroidota bacterium]